MFILRSVNTILTLYYQNVNSYKETFFTKKVKKRLKIKVSKIMSKYCRIKCQKPSCQKECQNCVKKNIKNKSVKTSVLNNVQINVKKQSINNDDLKKWRRKCQNQSVKKTVKMVSKNLSNVLLSKMRRKRHQNQHLVLVVS
jgi:hypothetical protein